MQQLKIQLVFFTSLYRRLIGVLIVSWWYIAGDISRAWGLHFVIEKVNRFLVCKLMIVSWTYIKINIIWLLTFAPAQNGFVVSSHRCSEASSSLLSSRFFTEIRLLYLDLHFGLCRSSKWRLSCSHYCRGLLISVLFLPRWFSALVTKNIKSDFNIRYRYVKSDYLIEV